MVEAASVCSHLRNLRLPQELLLDLDHEVGDGDYLQIGLSICRQPQLRELVDSSAAAADQLVP